MSAPLPPLRPRAMYGSEFVFPTDPSTHLFFDDDRGNVNDVQGVANNLDYNWNLSSVLCLPTHMTLYGLGGGPRNFDCAKQQDKDEYYTLKKNDSISIAKDIADPYDIGTGITREIIQKIIEKETEPEPKRTGRYFFDFDMLLSQFNGGMKCPEKGADANPAPEWVGQYAKYLFSDCIGAEPENGRLNLFKTMFEAIGPERIYIITANPYASTTYILPSSGRVVTWCFDIFVRLLQVLLPSFIPIHLVYANIKVQSKSTKIRYILDSRLKGGARSKARKTKRTKSKTRKTRSKAIRIRKTRSRTRSKASRRSRKNARRLS